MTLLEIMMPSIWQLLMYKWRLNFVYLILFKLIIDSPRSSNFYKLFGIKSSYVNRNTDIQTLNQYGCFYMHDIFTQCVSCARMASVSWHDALPGPTKGMGGGDRYKFKQN